MDNTLKSIKNKISSDKVRERQEGIRSLQEALQRKGVIAAVDQAGDGTGWLVLCQSLFDAFAKEHKACLKAGKDHPIDSFSANNAAVRRLCEVASTLRCLVERGVHRMNLKAMKALIEHLVRNVQFRGNLIPVALDYAKAIKCLLQWKPHLEHLPDESWITLTALSFNVILDDRIHAPLTYNGTVVSSHDTRADTPDAQTATSEQLSEEDEDQPMTISPAAKKRRRTERSTPRPAATRHSSRDSEMQEHPITLEQIEFASILLILLGSQSSSLVTTGEETSYLRPAILERLVRFLARFPTDSSLHYDYMRSVNAVLSHLALNERSLIIGFAREAWPGLLKQWGTKSQSLKEHLIITLRTLFPYLTAGEEGGSRAVQAQLYDGINALWQYLWRDADKRGAEGLFLDSLRLQSMPSDAQTDVPGPFVAHTFRHGWHFDANQAMIWAMFELQADCAEKLYAMSESMHSVPMTETEGKRRKWCNPINDLLDSIGVHTLNNVRIYRLQALLFFIDRHWLLLHAGLRKLVVDRLQACLSIEDPLTQSWALLCIGAIAHAHALDLATSSTPPTPSQISSHDYAIPWDYIWQQVMRRSTTPALSRAACHAANVLIVHSKQLLDSHKVLIELQSLTKDLTIQGPSYPNDAVCSFLISCMRIASQDVRLYRMQLEEKVLTWFMDTWRPGGVAKSRLAPYIVEDILALLGTICGITKRAEVLSPQYLPKGSIVDAAVTERDNTVVRDFLLSARLPPYRSRMSEASVLIESHSNVPPSLSESTGDALFDRILVEPRARERRISGYLLKSLEELISNWESNKDSSVQFPAEKTRTYLDLAVISLCHEGGLIYNGTQPSRRVLQAACKLLTLITTTLEGRRWSASELGLILTSLDPLILDRVPKGRFTPWETLLPPGRETGILFEMLRTVHVSGQDADAVRRVRARRELQRAIMRSSDVQDAFATVLKTLRIVLRKALNPNAYNMDKDLSSDGFERTKVAAEVEPIVDDNIAWSDIHAAVDVCVTALSVLPALQSPAGEATRDKELVQVIEECPGYLLPLVSPSFLDNVRRKVLSIKSTTVVTVLETIGELLYGYHHSRSEALQYLLIEILDATMHIWLQSMVDADLRDRIESLIIWLNNLCRKEKMRSWICRDRLARFYDRYLHEDPLQDAWVWSVEDMTPTEIMYSMLKDDDIRVRFRAVAVIPRCFELPDFAKPDALHLYDHVRKNLSKELSQYGAMLTRLLFLGNMMIVSSAVRRAVYWHFLETCLHTAEFNKHMGAILQGLADRFGLTSSQLFEIYAPQIAYTIRHNRQDFLRIPPHLIGYQDRRQCAEACFHAFTPTNILAGDTAEVRLYGRSLFERHCQVVSRTPAQGILDCFAEIVGYQIVSWIGDHEATGDLEGESLTQQLQLVTQDLGTGNDHDRFLAYLTQYADSIVVTILRTLADQDFSSDGPIVAALLTGERASVADEFLALSKHRQIQDFTPHEPNLPAYRTSTVINALDWFTSQVAVVHQSAITFHVLHQLFADLNRSPLINERIRIYNAIALWLALHRDHVLNSNVLPTVINGATITLQQSDSARSARSLLEWLFSIIETSNVDIGTHLAETLIRVSCAAYGYSIHNDGRIVSLGHELMNWIETRSAELYRHERLKTQVLTALATWPRELPEYLSAIWQMDTPPDVSDLLKKQRILSNKFRIVRPLRQLAMEGSYDEVQFSTSDFWRLKECIPPFEQVLNSDIDAFCELLVLQKGHIDGLVNDSPVSSSVRTEHLSEFNRSLEHRNTPSDSNAAKRAIISSLLSILDESSVTRVHDAYVTLKSLPSDKNQELEVFRLFYRPVSERPIPDVTSLSTDESFLDIAADFHTWTLRMALFLNDILGGSDRFYFSLAAILQINAEFAEQILPVLAQCVLTTERLSHKDDTASPISDALSRYFTRILSSDFASIACRRLIVDVLLHLRNFPRGTGDALGHDKWLRIDYVLLSKNALTCGLYTTALLFIELAAEHSTGFTLEAADIEDIMHNIYSHIDEPDGFYGIKTSDLSGSLIKRFHHENQWEKAFQFHGAGFEAGSSGTADAEGLLQALHSFGFDKLATQTLHGPSGSHPGFQSSSMAYRLGWRTDTWDLPETTKYRDPGVALYAALRAVDQQRDGTASDMIIRAALREELAHLRKLGNEDFIAIRQITQSLMCLNQVSRWRSDEFQSDLLAKKLSDPVVAQLCRIDLNFDFSDLEAILATRTALLRSKRRKEQREQIGDMTTSFYQDLRDLESRCLLRLSEAARYHEQAQIALNSVTTAQQLGSRRMHFEVSQEFAQVLWLKKEPKYAVQHLHHLLAELDKLPEEQREDVRRANLLSMLGTWTSEACLEKPAHVMAQYFVPASRIMDSQPHAVVSPVVYYKFAIFADKQYHMMAKSPDALRLKLYLDRKTLEVESRKRALDGLKNTASPEYKLAKTELTKTTKVLEEDKRRYDEHIESRDTFLMQAVQMYSRSLELSDNFDDDSAIRLCSLWFANFDYDSERFQSQAAAAVGRVASRKFVFLAHQLTARLSRIDSSSQSTSQKSLQSLVTRMCREHPFHSLYQVFCLQSESDSLPDVSRRQSKRHSSMSQVDRTLAAKTIFAQLFSDDACGSRVQEVEKLCRASLAFANYPIKDRYARTIPPKYIDIPKGELSLCNIRNFQVPVMTLRVPLDITCRYDSCVWIYKYKPQFSTAGGVNLPKIATCIGSDGKAYKQLFKGEGGDDLRQDAVMQQVFDLVNMELNHDKESRRRHLKVRGYKIIPLASQAGVLEYVDNTTQMSIWLGKAHYRYHPNEPPRSRFHELDTVRKANLGNPAPHRALFKRLWDLIKPVMKHYFMERHKTPMSWFRLRLNYSRSVATTSIVGHILGLGDRHPSNILMDNGTGEVVHIDLGIAFDQGKLLAVPEKVPFRLTRDMIDGLGVTGTQGVFQRCAEETLRVLRDRSDVILTVLEVFKHDPLHSWTASELKARRVQSGETVANHLTEEVIRHAIGGLDMASGVADEAADRAVTSVSKKLDKALTVEFMVNELISEATDFTNLADIYYGWNALW